MRAALLRPQTAGAQGRTANEIRPLGRVTQQAPTPPPTAGKQSAAAITMEHNAAAFTSVKTAIITLQRKLESWQGNSAAVFAERAAIERQLLSQTSEDEATTTARYAALLETLMSRIEASATVALGKKPAPGSTASAASPPRAGGLVGPKLTSFMELIDDVLAQKSAGVYNNNNNSISSGAHRLVDAPSSQLADGSMGSTTTGPPSAVVAAMLPNNNDVRRPSMQNTAQPDSGRVQHLREMINAGRGPTTAHAETALPNKSVAPSAAHSNNGANHHDLEVQQLRLRVSELEKEVRRLQERCEAEEGSQSLRASFAVGFPHQLRRDLEEEGIEFPKVALGEVENTFASKFIILLNECMAGGSSPDGKDGKTKGKSSRTSASASAVEAGSIGESLGATWWAMGQQVRTLESSIVKIRELKVSHHEALQAATREIQRLRTLAESLAQQQEAVAAERQKDARLRNAAELKAAKAMSEAAKERPVVSTDQLLRAQVNESKSKRIAQDMSTQMAALQQELDNVQLSLSYVTKEKAALLTKWQQECQLTEEKQKMIQQLQTDMASLHEVTAGAKKELREKAMADSDLHARMWQLEVELNIAQNVILELRQREQGLQQASMDAAEGQRLLREAMQAAHDAHTAEMARYKEEVKRAHIEEEVSKQVLKGERVKMAENEKEVERLRSLDVQMEVLEQNFANYAACKIAQREAAEEEEKLLQTCVDAVGKDAFVLPSYVDTEDQVRLHLQQLQRAKATFDAEERARRRHKTMSVNFKEDRSARKQLAVIMQQRYSAIQVFACEQRLAQLASERKQRELELEVNELKSRHESALVELAHSKSQGDLLLQRNGELELTKKEMARSRVQAEQEMKNLRATIHRMRISTEEQEKVLVDVGSRLQKERMKHETAEEPLPSVLFSD